MPTWDRVHFLARRRLVAMFERLHLKRLARTAVRAMRAPGISAVQPEVVRILPHDRLAQTQGLTYAEGQIYESTGLVGCSTVRRIDPETGMVRDSHPVPDVWAEGIAVHQGLLVQLTYTEGVAIVYRIPGLEIDRTFRYTGEGWGLAAAGDGYVMSDGSHILAFRNTGFEVTYRLQVSLAGRPVPGLNDLECAYGRIYANVLLQNDIYEISPQSGAVLRVIDCSELVDLARHEFPASVLNGIAFAPDRNTFFVTGKRWPLLFELEWPR